MPLMVEYARCLRRLRAFSAVFAMSVAPSDGARLIMRRDAARYAFTRGLLL